MKSRANITDRAHRAGLRAVAFANSSDLLQQKCRAFSRTLFVVRVPIVMGRKPIERLVAQFVCCCMKLGRQFAMLLLGMFAEVPKWAICDRGEFGQEDLYRFQNIGSDTGQRLGGTRKTERCKGVLGGFIQAVTSHALDYGVLDLNPASGESLLSVRGVV